VVASTPAVDTVTDAVKFLESEGYHDEVTLLADDLVRCNNQDRPLSQVVIDHLFRFEGPSDPADEAIVIGVSFTEDGRKGVVIAPFGPDADPDEVATLTALTRRAG